MNNISEYMKSLAKKTINLEFDFSDIPASVGATRFGGMPDVPDDFKWPYYSGSMFPDEEPENRPLSFICQINCRDIAELDSENLLPHSGVLSFFYEMCVQPWGFDPKHTGGARVFYFENENTLSPAEYPSDMADEYKYTAASADFSVREDYPSPQEIDDTDDDKYDEYCDSYDEFIDNIPDFQCKLLGYPGLIQGDISIECELVTRGIYTGDGRVEITDEIRKAAEDWTLLFQMDTIDDCDMMFGDSGRLYFCIKKQDLAEKRFDKVWTILQCF